MPAPIERIKVTSYSRPASAIERTFYGSLIEDLAAARIHIEMTQEELDRKLGVADGQVAKWESFARLPGAFMMVCWANAVGISLVASLTTQAESDEACHPLETDALQAVR